MTPATLAPTAWVIATVFLKQRVTPERGLAVLGTPAARR
jgi:hypothetical protein